MPDRDPADHARFAFFRDGRLTSLPAKPSIRHAALSILAERFTPGRAYAEVEVNAVLADDAPDHATLRRLLVDEGLLVRERGTYTRVASGEAPHD